MKDNKADDYLEFCIVNKCCDPDCDNYAVKRDLILKIIDGQASEEELRSYNEVISKCNNCKCREYCEQELAIKNLIQTKLDRKRVPLDIVDKIRAKISKNI